MPTTTSFPFADCLLHLERLHMEETRAADASLPAWLVQAFPAGKAHAKIIDSLIQLLTARKAVWQAALDTGLVADELRRYQKFAKPGQPSAHIVQLRQKQAAARQASSIARQSFVRAAAAWVRDADIEVSQRMPLETFVNSWIDTHLPGAR